MLALYWPRWRLRRTQKMKEVGYLRTIGNRNDASTFAGTDLPNSQVSAYAFAVTADAAQVNIEKMQRLKVGNAQVDLYLSTTSRRIPPWPTQPQ